MKATIIYLNKRTAQGVETVDEFSSDEDHVKGSLKAFRKYVSAMVAEYNIVGQAVYRSGRSTNEWRNK